MAEERSISASPAVSDSLTSLRSAWVVLRSLPSLLHTASWRDLDSRQAVPRPLGFRWFRCTSLQRHQKPCKRRRGGALRAILKVLQFPSHQNYDAERWSARSPSRGDDRDVRKGTLRPYPVRRETCWWWARRGHRRNGETRTNVDGEQTQEEGQPHIA